MPWACRKCRNREDANGRGDRKNEGQNGGDRKAQGDSAERQFPVREFRGVRAELSQKPQNAEKEEAQSEAIASGERREIQGKRIQDQDGRHSKLVHRSPRRSRHIWKAQKQYRRPPAREGSRNVNSETPNKLVVALQSRLCKTW